jgi:hypothetical protein
MRGLCESVAKWKRSKEEEPLSDRQVDGEPSLAPHTRTFLLVAENAIASRVVRKRDTRRTTSLGAVSILMLL